MNIDPLSKPFVAIPEIPETGSSNKRQRTIQNQVTSTATPVFVNQATKPSSSQPLPIIYAIPQNISPIAQAVSYRQWSEVYTLLETSLLFSADEEISFDGRFASIFTVTAASGDWFLASLMLKKDPRAKTNPYSSGKLTTGKTALYYALTNKHWELVRLMNENDPDIHIDADSEILGMMSPLFYVMVHGQWDLALSMFKNKRSVQVDCTGTFGPGKGERSAIWYAAYKKQWNVVSAMFDKDRGININAAPTEGTFQGATLLWLTVGAKQWKLANTMLNMNCTADIYAASIEGVPVWRLVVESQQWSVAANLLYNHFVKKVDTNPPEGGFSTQTYDLADLLFLKLRNCSDEIKEIIINYLVLENVPHPGTTWDYLQKAKDLIANLETNLKDPSELLICPRKPRKAPSRSTNWY